ncbi:MAG TPA: DegQ family serine endoprotease [Bauldia sp.]|nr:DegQ family serine endoprotease [Bauldia sp.]
MRAVILVAAGLGFVPQATAEQWRIVPESSTQIQYSFAPIVKRVAPAVVNVYASRVVEQSLSPFISDPFFRHFFGGPDVGAPIQRVQRSLGSGVIVDPSGIIITNHHVIANSDEIKVALADRREFDCDVVLSDQRTDLAVLRVKNPEGDLPFAELSDSDQLEVGDLVLAIGDPFGVGQTVTSGIVSALARTQVGVSDYQFFIQTDAAINPGNSGGPLVDMSGKIVGINTAIYSRTGDSNGIGFAIPSNMVRVVAESAKAGVGHLRMPWIGVRFQEVTPDIADGLGLERPRGALVTEVAPETPGARAGLKTGDLIVSIDGVEINDPTGINYRLATKGIGATATLVVVRDAKEYVAKLELEAAPETVPRDEIEIAGFSPLTGARVLNLSPAVAEELAHEGTTEGVIVGAVAGGSLADEAGLLRGDVVIEVNGIRITSTRHLAQVCADRVRYWEIVIERKGRLIRSQFRA